MILDNHAPYGDATTPIDEATSMGPVSTLTGCFLAQCVMGRFVELLKEHGMEAPVFASSNMDGADERNRELFDVCHQDSKIRNKKTAVCTALLLLMKYIKKASEPVRIKAGLPFS
ncbi:MAG: hypothetical protein ACLTDX_04930 [[Clostridium] innocuum]